MSKSIVSIVKVDTIVLAMGADPQKELYAQIKDMVKQLYIIGDAMEPRSGLEAIEEGARVGREI